MRERQPPSSLDPSPGDLHERMKEMTVRADVVCASHGGRGMHVDIYDPHGPVNHRTAVLVHHGGGWRLGDRKMMGPRCEALAARGFTAVAVEYRSISEAPWPAQLQDVKAAVRWTHVNAADLGIDRIVMQGHSAGAHLALIAAGAAGRPDLDPDIEAAPSGPIAAVVAYYPLVRLDPDMSLPNLAEPGPATFAALRGSDGSVPAAMLLGPEGTKDAARAASPIEYVTEKFPPTILFHGTTDSVVASAASTVLSETLAASDVSSEVHLIAGVDHEFDATPSLTDVCVPAVESFLSRVVIDPEAFREEEAATNPIVAMRRAMQA